MATTYTSIWRYYPGPVLLVGGSGGPLMVEVEATEPKFPELAERLPLPTDGSLALSSDPDVQEEQNSILAARAAERLTAND